MYTLDLIAENPESTVVARYERETSLHDSAYQSEAELEKAFIAQLERQAYERLSIRSETDLIDNLRQQLSLLNHYEFSDSEWTRFFNTVLANKNKGIAEKSRIIQAEEIQVLECDDGTKKNIRLVDKRDIHNNRLQVLNQYEVNDTERKNRYDVTVLVNGLPLVHIELKRRGVDIREAFNQINRYQRESFWSGSGLFEYVQLFVISNGTYTKYYSNTTRNSHLRELQQSNQQQNNGRKTSHSFEFTSWWSDAKNKPITELMDFCKTFFAKHSLLKILFRYCVFTSDELLLVMRPYQIAATERILNKIDIAHHNKLFGTRDAGGFVWHTTGSGKTLTSFKTAQLASQSSLVKKVLFVVDRKDLDYQTMKEYDKFQKGAANSNTSTAILAKQLADPELRIIITTIQKLATFIKKNKGHQIFDDEIVMIFDECHRSQFGEMHTAITKAFKRYALFGFTGTPILGDEAQGRGPLRGTTETVFGQCLHVYTIVHAIADKNVLPFRVDYVSTVRESEHIEDKQVVDIDRERVLNSPVRIAKITEYILTHFNQKTQRNDKSYFHTYLSNVAAVAGARQRERIEEVKQKIRLSGFNSIFAVSSIDTAKLYYHAFKEQQALLPEAKRIKVATIFSYGANEVLEDGLIDDENADSTEGLSVSHRDFLEQAIADYNQMFKTNYDTSSESFQSYYKDISLRMKNREIDLLIVVNMFLTGFDATTLSTLWVDKNLRMHGLLQAYSRTNRILNSIKRFGNIVCFRNLEQETNESLARFGNENARSVVLMRSFNDYYYGYTDDYGKAQQGYVDIVAELQEHFPAGDRIDSEKAKKEFIRLYGAFLKLRNILNVYDEFSERMILSERQVQDYHSMYIDLYEEFRPEKKDEVENINDDVVFEMELVKQVDVNIDYILELVRLYHEDNTKDKEIIVKIEKAVDSSVELRNKRDLILNFVHNLSPQADMDTAWREHVEREKAKQIDEVIAQENLKADLTHSFMEDSLKDGYFSEVGINFANILPPMSRFTPNNERGKKRETVAEKLKTIFNRFLGL